mmetsp:Transcript_47611/g.134107  ORF Transcript_47611/g.134107 Transcript_47611/m.134107 type:complete len:202 (-) Transcript_47611:14-619(-)
MPTLHRRAVPCLGTVPRATPLGLGTAQRLVGLGQAPPASAHLLLRAPHDAPGEQRRGFGLGNDGADRQLPRHPAGLVGDVLLPGRRDFAAAALARRVPQQFGLGGRRPRPERSGVAADVAVRRQGPVQVQPRGGGGLAGAVDALLENSAPRLVRVNWRLGAGQEAAASSRCPRCQLCDRDLHPRAGEGGRSDSRTELKAAL